VEKDDGTRRLALTADYDFNTPNTDSPMAKTATPAAKTPRTFYLGTGRRKTAVARVRITEGKGQVLINGRPLDEYFHEDKDRAAVLGPLKVTEQLNRLDVFVKAKGGGVTGQAGAVSQGIARAIKTMFSPKDEQRAVSFHQTTVIRAYHNEAREREKAKAIPVKPAAPTPAPAADGQPLIPGGTPAAPAAPTDPTAGLVKKLRDSGYLTRDARMKERKKNGLRGARRGTQFSKR
jgi:small subunit ribosomal protein S9